MEYYKYYKLIKFQIEKILNNGLSKIIICPYGELGILSENILKKQYGIDAYCILDNKLCVYNKKVHNIKYISKLENTNCAILLATEKIEVQKQLLKDLNLYIEKEKIYNVFKDIDFNSYERTIVGKYSYGPLCNHQYVKSVGAFTSIALGADVVENHPIEYISTHPFLYYGNNFDEDELDCFKEYNEYSDEPWYFKDICPQGKYYKFRRVKIGNDVWIGRNVIITNGSNIGNGAIIGAGSIVTRDVPDYAIVAGTPARIIRYRYNDEQIKILNKIQWWNWSDDEIRERYNDFYLPIGKFIDKYYNINISDKKIIVRV